MEELELASIERRARILTSHNQINGAGQFLALDAQTALDLAVIAGLHPLDADAALAAIQPGAVVLKARCLAPRGRQIEDLLLAGYLNAAIVDGASVAAEQLDGIALVEQCRIGLHIHLAVAERICKRKGKR